MDQSEVRFIVNEHVKPIRDALQLNDWHIDTEYTALDPGTSARVHMMPRYRRATIQFDPAQIVDREHVLRCLRHELLHLVLAPFDLYTCAVSEMLPEQFSKVDNQLFMDAVELVVGNLERVLDWGIPFRPWEAQPSTLQMPQDNLTPKPWPGMDLDKS